ncbi:MAG: alpha/beta hydrolase [Chitinophagaceae bacterium]|nr:alpha/beta hydrolase [Chitinophagaceae bacterium]
MAPLKISFTLLLLLFSYVLPAQEVNKLVGSWEGKLNVGIELRVVFHIKEDAKSGFITTADSPDQSAYGLKCDNTTIKENEVIIEMNTMNASFTGKLLNDSTIEGMFKQGAELPLTLRKVTTTAENKENKRPQTPKPPFSYQSEDVLYYSRDKSLTYGATITIPKGNGPFPSIVLITGSGQQDRDENILGHKIFAVIADHLTKAGYIVLRADDRGMGKSTGIFNEATSEDFAIDVSNSVDYLLTRPEADKNKIGLIGHSEGGMIAPMVAAKRNDIHFVILLAAPGVRIVELMAEQNAAIAKANGASKETTESIKPLFIRVANAIYDAPDSAQAFANAAMITENWVRTKSIDVLKELEFETVAKREAYITEMVKEFRSPWFRYFLKFDPGPYLEQLKCKVLALNGEKDIQVISSQNLAGIKRALKNSSSKQFEIKELPNLNHLFQTCEKCTIEEYGQLTETFSPVALQIISDWLNKNIK